MYSNGNKKIIYDIITEEYFIIKFDQEWDFSPDNDPYEGYFIINGWHNILNNYKIIDKVNGPTPVEFLTYKGMYGFKVYFPSNKIEDENNNWIFYTYDIEQKKYIEVGKIVD